MEEAKKTQKVSPFWNSIKLFFKKLWDNFLKPALKDIAAGAIGRVTNQVIYQVPPDATVQNRNATTAGVPWTQSRPTNIGGRNTAGPDIYLTAGADAGVNNLSSANRSKLEIVLNKARAEMAKNNSVSKGELYFFAQQSANPPDYNVGWTSLDGFRIEYNVNTNDYTLILPTISNL